MILIHVETDGLRAKVNVGYIHQSQSQTNIHKQKSSPDLRTNGLVIFTVSIMILITFFYWSLQKLRFTAKALSRQ